MSDKTLRQILESTRQLIAVKTAEYNTNVKSAGEVSGGDTKGKDSRLGPVDSTNKTLDAGEAALEPTKKPLLSSDAKADPASDGSGTKADLRGKDEDNKTSRKNTLEASDPAPVKKTEKDLISGDANAKTAAATIANEILGAIRESQKKAQSGETSGESGSGETSGEEHNDADDKKKKAAAEKKEAAAPAPAVTPAKTDIKPAVESKKASEGPMLELTSDVLAKIAAMVLSTDEGAEFVEGFMAKQAGAEAAKETLAFLAKQAELAEKQAAYEQGQADAEALINQAIYMAGVNAQKQAEAQVPQGPFAKLGQAVADASMSDLMGQMGGAPGAAGADAGAGAPPEAGAGDGSEGEISPEELQAALEALAQEGTITPEEAQQVMQYISSEGAGGAGEGEGAGAGEPPAAAPESAGEGAGSDENKAPAEEKESSVKSATAELLNAIRAARGKK